MKYKTTQKIWKEIVALFKTMDKEVTFFFKDKGLSVRVKDVSNSSIIQVSYAKFALAEGEGVVGVPLDKLEGALKGIKDKEMVEFEHIDGTITIKSANITKSFGALAEQGTPRMPGITLSNKFVVKYDVLANATKALDGKDGVLVGTDQEGAYLTQVDGKDKTTVRFDANTGLTETTGPAECVALSMELLGQFLGAIPECKVVTFSFERNKPLIINMENEYMELVYMLAPRILEE